ncbi:MAG: septum formation initiator family protein [Coriobacteriales bacterium]|nr:septum formation initiator family protein [Coriobacteriales bacterium]
MSQNQHSTRTTQRPTDRSSERAREPQHRFPKAMIILASIVAVLGFALIMIYPAAKEYYISTRERDQLQAEYDAVTARNNEMQGNVDALNTVEGVEDQARTDLGWTQPGEVSVEVTTLDPSTAHGAMPDEVEPGSVEAPESWLTRFLDKLFGLD